MATKRRKIESVSDVDVFERADGEFDVRAIRDSYDRNGYVVLRLLTERQCDDGIYELYEKLLMTQPWNDPHYHGGVSPFVLYDEKGEIRFPSSDEEHRRRVVAALKVRGLRKQELKNLQDHWTLHVTFGAPCDDIGFHLPRVWAVRQDPSVYKVVAALTRERELLVDINRPIMKLPTKGESEFLHWDLDLNNEFERTSRHVQGKVAYTPSRFVGVPATHTPEYREYFLSTYNAPKRGVKKTALNAATHGAEFEKQRVFELPAGCCVFWNSQMLHGQMPTPRDANIELGFYLGFFPAEGLDAGVHENRLRSYETGRAPEFWPSGDKIHFYPKLWQCNYDNIERTIQKMPKEHPSIDKRENADGRVFPDLKPWRPVGYERAYVPPPLTRLGKMLLGRRSWREHEEAGPSRAVQSSRVPRPPGGSSRLLSTANALYTEDGSSRDRAIRIE